MRQILRLSPATPRAESQATCHTTVAPSGMDIDVVCTDCDRRLCVLNRSAVKRYGSLPRILTTGGRILPDSDYCVWCSRPTSEAAKRRAPTEPFVAFARAVQPHREPALPRKPAAVSA